MIQFVDAGLRALGHKALSDFAQVPAYTKKHTTYSSRFKPSALNVCRRCLSLAQRLRELTAPAEVL